MTKARMQSLILGLAVGLAAGLYFGWIHFPTEKRWGELGDLTRRYQDEYTVMIAAGYGYDGDRAGALARLELLDADDAGTYLRAATERVIQTSARSLEDIRLLAGLARDLGQLTRTMEPFLDQDGAA